MHRWAAIFDWDGVVIDSSRQHERGWELLAKEEGHVLPPGFFRRSFGMRNDRVIGELLGWAHDLERTRQLSSRKETLYRELIEHDRIEPLPGVVEWLDALRNAGGPCAIGSSTPLQNIECVIAALKLRGYFEAIVATEDVSRGKPDPDVFLTAAHRLEMPPQRCVVFEDAHVGLAAARAGGMKVVGVVTTHSAETLAGAARVVSRPDELSPEEV